jgi:serine/threonine protein kinase
MLCFKPFIKTKRVCSEENARLLMKQLISGLEHILSKNILYRDLKAENIMVKNGILKFCDFGMQCSEVDYKTIGEKTDSAQILNTYFNQNLLSDHCEIFSNISSEMFLECSAYTGYYIINWFSVGDRINFLMNTGEVHSYSVDDKSYIIIEDKAMYLLIPDYQRSYSNTSIFQANVNADLKANCSA